MDSEILFYLDKIRNARLKIDEWQVNLCSDSVKLSKLRSDYFIGDTKTEYMIKLLERSISMAKDIIDGQQQIEEFARKDITAVAKRINRDRELDDLLKAIEHVKIDGNSET